MNLATAVSRNHDLFVRVTGPAIAAPAAVFDYDWQLAVDPAASFPAEPASGPCGVPWPHRLKFVVTRPGRSNQLELVLGLLRFAERRIWLEMFLFTEPGIVTALAEARARGVEIRVIVDPMEYALGLRLHGAPNLPFVGDMLDSGIPVRLFRTAPGRQMHQKSLVVDGRYVLTGTTNFTRQGFRVNTESSFLVDGSDVAVAYERRFLDDWLRGSAPPDPELFSRRRVWLSLVRQACRWI
jgi:phosphatidylserine/phosphatidylglycerophosphate/cardiolipin synthase-like enzyme